MKDGVAGVIFSDNRTHVLWIKRRDIPIWVLPGGGIEPNEPPEETVIREILEETGLQTSIVRKTGDYYPINRLASRTHIYECKIIGGNLEGGEESLRCAFFTIDSPPSPMLEVHYEWMKEAFANHPDILKKPISQITYWKVFTFFLKHPMLVIRALCARIGFPINS